MAYLSESQASEPETVGTAEKDERLKEFKRIKERFAFLTGKKEKTQEEFNSYINSLFDGDSCKYMTGIRDIVSLCNNTLFECRFRSRDQFSFSGKSKFECERERMLRLRSLV